MVLRQPKRKEETLAGCWGRLAYRVDIGDHGGPAIILEAVDLSRPMRWSKSLRPEQAAELERLREDGHRITTTSREHIVEWTFDSIRSTQLFRTLFHEIGHWVDFLESVERPSSVAPDPTEAYGAYQRRYFDSKPKAEKEAFAHGYAARLRSELMDKRRIPFTRILDRKRLKKDGLQKEDFCIE